MAITKERKKEIVEKVRNILDKAKSVVFVNFHGVSVDEINEIRGEFNENNVGYFVAKKTLAGRALDEAKIEGERPDLEGELALAWSEEEETVPARKVYDFQKELKDSFQIIGGIFEGKYRNQEEMTEIAKIPSEEVLRGMFLNVINSPIQGLAVALNQIAENKS